MGMFDRISDMETRCPVCGMRCLNEVQTHDFDCTMTTYHISDGRKSGALATLVGFWNDKIAIAPKKLKIVEATFSCKEPVCQAYGRMQDFGESGYISGFGLTFDVEYDVRRNGHLKAPARFVTPVPDLDKIYRDFVHKVGNLSLDENRKKWAAAMKMCRGNEMLAVLHFHPEAEK